MPATLVPVQTLSQYGHVLLKPFTVAIEQSGDSYVATFYDAGISASGDNETEAFQNLTDMISATFELGSRHDIKLGPGPARQLAVLREFVYDASVGCYGEPPYRKKTRQELDALVEKVKQAWTPEKGE